MSDHFKEWFKFYRTAYFLSLGLSQDERLDVIRNLKAAIWTMENMKDPPRRELEGQEK